MNFEELTNIWKESDQEIGNTLTINKQILKELSFSKIKDHLTEIKWTSYLEIILNIFFFIFLINFIINYSNDPKFLIPAIILLAICIFTFVFEGYKLQLFHSIHTKNSILKTQQQLSKLRYLELLDTKLLYVFIPLFSAPFLIVACKSFLEINLYALGNRITIYTIGSFFIAVLIVFFLSKYPDKNLQRALDFIDELKTAEEA